MSLKKITLRLDEKDIQTIDKVATEQNTTRANINPQPQNKQQLLSRKEDNQ